MIEDGSNNALWKEKKTLSRNPVLENLVIKDNVFFHTKNILLLIKESIKAYFSWDKYYGHKAKIFEIL